jgi:hypothetical protein
VAGAIDALKPRRFCCPVSSGWFGNFIGSCHYCVALIPSARAKHDPHDREHDRHFYEHTNDGCEPQQRQAPLARKVGTTDQ